MKEVLNDEEEKDRWEAEWILKDTLAKEKEEEMREKDEYMQETRNIIALWKFINEQIDQKKQKAKFEKEMNAKFIRMVLDDDEQAKQQDQEKHLNKRERELANQDFVKWQMDEELKRKKQKHANPMSNDEMRMNYNLIKQIKQAIKKPSDNPLENYKSSPF